MSNPLSVTNTFLDFYNRIMEVNTNILKNHHLWPKAFWICDLLQKKGYIAYFAGGCVRDFVIGRSPKDIDIATSASPDQIAEIFPDSNLVGAQFGAVKLYFNLEDGSRVEIDVTTFRKDGLYIDGRKPESIEQATPEEDAHRRDFKMNSLFFNPLTEEIMDFVGGIQDIQNHTISTVGNPSDRFNEDHLRILRGFRFVAELDFKMDLETEMAARKLSLNLLTVSRERIQDEIRKILKSSKPFKGVFLLFEEKIIQRLFIFLASKDFKSNKLQLTKLLQNSISELFFYTGIYLVCESNVNAFEIYKEDLKSFKLSNKIVTEIQEICLFPLGEIVSDRKLGNKAILYFKRNGSLFNQWVQFTEECKLHLYRPSDLLLWNQLHQEIKSKWPMGLPKPLINGEMLKHKFSGKELGELLNRTYVQQLENPQWGEKELLSWVQNSFTLRS